MAWLCLVMRKWANEQQGDGGSHQPDGDEFAVEEKRTLLGGGFKDFLFSPLFGEDSQFDDSQSHES